MDTANTPLQLATLFAKVTIRLQLHINPEFMPLAFEIYGSASVSVNKLIQDLASTDAERTYTPYHVLLFNWRKRISFILQYYNTWIIKRI